MTERIDGGDCTQVSSKATFKGPWIGRALPDRPNFSTSSWCPTIVPTAREQTPRHQAVGTFWFQTITQCDSLVAKMKQAILFYWPRLHSTSLFNPCIALHEMVHGVDVLSGTQVLSRTL